MRIIFSPAKTMREVPGAAKLSRPALLEKTAGLLEILRGLSPAQLRTLWGCSEKIALKNLERLEAMELEKALSPAIMSFEGIAFKYMDPGSFSAQELEYAEEHLRILSGFYGVLRPMDGIRAYRLDMENKLSGEGFADLYEFWGRDIYDNVTDRDKVIINLASGEYSASIKKYLGPADRFISCSFAEESGGKLKQKGTFAKMARGAMLRYMARQGAESPEAMQSFRELDFAFSPEYSTEEEYVFIRRP